MMTAKDLRRFIADQLGEVANVVFPEQEGEECQLSVEIDGSCFILTIDPTRRLKPGIKTYEPIRGHHPTRRK